MKRLSQEAVQERVRMRHKALSVTRLFFNEQSFYEIDTPILIGANSLEPHIAPMPVPVSIGYGQDLLLRYLHTSPELFLKRVLSYGLPQIYSLSHVFRDGELGPRHLPEFSMLEWYRANSDLRVIIQDCESLFLTLAEAINGSSIVEHPIYGSMDLTLPYEVRTVESLWQEYAGIDLGSALHCMQEGDHLALVRAVQEKGHFMRPNADFEDAFHHIMVSVIEQKIGHRRPCVVIKWPRQMAVLARICKENSLYADRFEIYAHGLELANAFLELTDPTEQRKRFEDDNEARRVLSKVMLPLNESFLGDLAYMPQAAGIAVGFDRLLMFLRSTENVDDIYPLPWFSA